MTHLNVFRGSDAVKDYFDPDNNPPLPLVEIPDRLNPFRCDGVRIYAKLLTALPAHNVKSLPALGMLLSQDGASEKRIVEASSGSTVLSLGILSRVLWGNEDVTAYVTNKKHPDSLRLLRFFGLKVSLYGGLAQQEPTDPRGIMSRLRRLAAEDESTIYPGQYDNENNWKSHERWTGPQILKQLPEIMVFSTTVGTGGECRRHTYFVWCRRGIPTNAGSSLGCITGAGAYLKSSKPSVKVVGVFNVFGDPTPGPRHFHGFHTCGFPWKGTVDAQLEVSSVDSYRMSMLLSREGIIAGPSSGEALKGLLDYLELMKQRGRLSELSEHSTGEITCVFTCSDLPYQYLDGYFQKLGDHEFAPIENQILLSCDQEKHDERWIFEPEEALRKFSTGYYAKGPNRESLNPKPIGEHLCTACIPYEKVFHKASTPWSWLKNCFNGKQSNKPQLAKCGRIGQQETVSSGAIIDLRSAQSFCGQHIRGSYSLPLRGLTATTAGGDLFADPETVYEVWKSLRALFLEDDGASQLMGEIGRRGFPSLVLCYDGDASRLATSILRAKGVEAFSVAGGFRGIQDTWVSGRSRGASKGTQLATTLREYQAEK
ncbi:hypothetical protein DL769_001755 [Monosporascus sp. CRB-8-3]|nr:hypothetical protein DL769_001755 [Monosporascus sp. CRB-8-3]